MSSKNGGAEASALPSSMCARPAQMVHVKHCKLPRGQKEITGTIAELEKAHSPYNSSIWVVGKPDKTWHMTVNYLELNKVTPHLHAAVSSAKDILDQLTLVDLANVFFSIDLVLKSQDQCTFTWQDCQWTFLVLPQGYMHSPTLS
jgi:hypothetical protein